MAEKYYTLRQVADLNLLPYKSSYLSLLVRQGTLEGYVKNVALPGAKKPSYAMSQSDIDRFVKEVLCQK